MSGDSRHPRLERGSQAASDDDAHGPGSPLKAGTAENIRGRLREHADLSKTTWFQVGGPAEFLFKPEDAHDLAAFLRAKRKEVPVTVIGVGSNLLVRDGGVRGVVIRLGRGFTDMRIAISSPPGGEGQGGGAAACSPSCGESIVEVGAACLDVHAAQFACEQGIAGLEFLSGIPGTIGGAVAMNAGAYGADIAGVLVQAEIVDAQGNIRILSNEELGFTYRHASLPEGAIVTRAWLKGMPGDKGAIAAAIARIQAEREESQPVRARTGGSTFKNPPGHKAWELIDRAGCRGMAVGGAQVSEKHCNFLLNTGSATAMELERLGEEVRRRVREQSGIELEWEIRRIGEEKPED